jgi:hypothetical protein
VAAPDFLSESSNYGRSRSPSQSGTARFSLRKRSGYRLWAPDGSVRGFMIFEDSLQTKAWRCYRRELDAEG